MLSFPSKVVQCNTIGNEGKIKGKDLYPRQINIPPDHGPEGRPQNV